MTKKQPAAWCEVCGFELDQRGVCVECEEDDSGRSIIGLSAMYEPITGQFFYRVITDADVERDDDESEAAP